MGSVEKGRVWGEVGRREGGGVGEVEEAEVEEAGGKKKGKKRGSRMKKKRASRMGGKGRRGGEEEEEVGGKWVKKGLELECCDSFEEISFLVDFEEEGKLEINILGDIWEGDEGERGRRGRGREEGGVLREVIVVRDAEKEKRRILKEWVQERIKTYCPEVFFLFLHFFYLFF